LFFFCHRVVHTLPAFSSFFFFVSCRETSSMLSCPILARSVTKERLFFPFFISIVAATTALWTWS
jgi:hypothetical protein